MSDAQRLACDFCGKALETQGNIVVPAQELFGSHVINRLALECKRCPLADKKVWHNIWELVSLRDPYEFALSIAHDLRPGGCRWSNEAVDRLEALVRAWKENLR